MLVKMQYVRDEIGMTKLQDDFTRNERLHVYEKLYQICVIL